MEGDIIFERVRTWERHFNPLPPHGGRPFYQTDDICYEWISIHSLRMEGDKLRSHQLHYYKTFQSTPSAWRETCKTRLSGSTHRFQSTPSAWRETSGKLSNSQIHKISIHSLRMEGDLHRRLHHDLQPEISIHSLRMEGDSKTAQESVFHFAYPCTILQKRMQKTTFCTRKNGFFRKKGEKFGAKPSASFCAPMIRTDTFPLNFSHRISGSSMSMVSFAPICSTFD